jgi:hypothetical protein
MQAQFPAFVQQPEQLGKGSAVCPVRHSRPTPEVHAEALSLPLAPGLGAARCLTGEEDQREEALVFEANISMCSSARGARINSLEARGLTLPPYQLQLPDPVRDL